MSVQRFGTVVRLRPDKREEYLALHAAVWSAVERTITDCHIANYTIFLHGDLLFGYYEYRGDDLAADRRRMAADPETQSWWALTDPCQERLEGTPAGEQWAVAREIWHLD